MSTSHMLPPLSDMVSRVVLPSRCAGWTPKLDLPSRLGPAALPHVRALSRPKEMADTWRATKTHLMSSFCFNLTSVTCRELHQGVSTYKTRDWLGLDEHGIMRDQYSLTQGLIYAEKILQNDSSSSSSSNGGRMDVDYFGGGGRHNSEYAHRSTKYDTILWGCMNDGTSLAIHVTDFCPWLVFQFRNKKLAVSGIVSIMEKIKSQYPDQLGQIGFEIEPRACSDGILPSKRNPYNERKYNYVYVYTPDASYGARKTLKQAMESNGAQAVEDDALNESVRFLQKTQMCPTEWYTVTQWSDVEYGFNTSVQIEVSCKMADIVAMINAPEGVVLPPHTEVYWDIEHHKYESGSEEASSKRGFASADDPLNNIICINVAVWRTGAFDLIQPDDPCRQNMPRMDDEPIQWSQYQIANPTNADGEDQLAEVPDPLDVEQSRDRLKTSDLDQEYDEQALVEDNETNDATNGDNDDIFETAMASDALALPQEIVMESVTMEDLIKGLGQQLNIGNLDDHDLDSLDDIHALVGTMMEDKKNGTTTKPLVINSDLPLKNMDNLMDVDVETSKTAARQTLVEPESTKSRDARHGYEIPKWALAKLGARVDLAQKNESLPDMKRVQTPMLLKHNKYIRRVSFFVDPTLNRPSAKFLLKSLYKDEGDGVLVHAFRDEASALMAFRDFMVSVHPDMTSGHFTRSYDWKTLFTRANCTLRDSIPFKNTTRDSPIAPEKLLRHLPALEYRDMLSHPERPFPVAQKQLYYDAISDFTASVPHSIVEDAKSRRVEGKHLAKKTSRTSCFAFMNRLLFSPCQLTRKITRSSNTVAVESLCPTFDGFADIDSLICVRLALPTLKKFSLNYLCEIYLKDAKMDIGIPRMNACYRQKQYWPVIAYCDYDCVLVGALMSALSLRMAHAALSRCSHLSMHEIPNFGQQRRIFVKNALVAHVTGMVLVRCGIVCPQIFGGGHVETPTGGIYPVPCNCLDYVSFYVTLMMEHNLCFTAYMIPWDQNFEPMVFDPYDAVAALKANRTFAKNLRRVYGAPDYRRRPNSLPYFTCRKCQSENFALVPTDVTLLELASLPSHEILDQDSSLSSVYTRSVPSNCPTCQGKPWLAIVEPEYDTSQAPDTTSPLDPHRELRFATDFDYLVPRSSMVSFQSDPEAYEMHELKRYKPGSQTEFVREDILVEHEVFDWIDPEVWAKQRFQVCFAAFQKTLKEKKKGKKKEMANVKYVPSVANFVLWRPGDFDNQARRIYTLQQIASGTYNPSVLPIDEAEQEMMQTIGNQVWTVDTFEAYADATARKADIERIKAFESRSPFDRSKYDVRCRRGIVKYGSTTSSVQKLFRSRKATTAAQGALKRNGLYFNPDTEKWLDGVIKTLWEGLNAKQLGEKGSANSMFGAAGTQTGSIKNTFVAAAITFMSRNLIYFTTYVTLTRWCPSMELYERICHYRKLILEKREKVGGVMQKYMERFVDKSPWPTHPDAGRQVWLKPICSAYQVRNDPVECLFGIFNAYGDTDSIFPCLAGLVLGDPDDPIHALDMDRRKLAIAIGISMAKFVTSHFRMANLKWITIEFEKKMYPFFLFDWVKKRYIGGHWEKPEKMKQITKRSFGIRRDIPVIQQQLTQMAIDVLVTTMSGESLDAMFRSFFLKMMERGGEIHDFERDVAVYSKSQAFNKPEYASVTCHVSANQRLATAFSGEEHPLGDRIEYVICYDPTQPEVAKRSWTLKQIRLMLEERDAYIQMGRAPPKQISELRIDIPYYIECCLATVADVYTITKPPRQVYDRPCMFALSECMLQKLVASGRWPNMILPGASTETHLAHYNAVASGLAPKTTPRLSMQDLQSCMQHNYDGQQAIGGFASSSNVLHTMMHCVSHKPSSGPPKNKKQSPLAKLLVDRYIAMARSCVSQTLSKTSIGIHSFFDHSGSTHPDTDQMFQEFEVQKAKQEALRLEAKKRMASTAPPVRQDERHRKMTKSAVCRNPKMNNALITSFFSK